MSDNKETFTRQPSFTEKIKQRLELYRRRSVKPTSNDNSK